MARSHRFRSCIRPVALFLLAAAAATAGPRFGFRGSATLRSLPRGHATYYHGGSPYYFHRGHWYGAWRGGYRWAYPPIGLGLSVLPLGYMTLWFGGVPYYCYDDVYYRESASGGYVVVDPPEEPRASPAPGAPPAAPAARPASPDAAALDALLIIPKKGQSEEQMQADRQAAQRYALDKSGFDPATSDPQDPGTPRARQAYLRAMRSYLEERGYSVK